MRPLAGEIDALLTAREADIMRARSHAGDLAHGLKTPLQALLGEAERLRQGGETRAAAASNASADVAATIARIHAVLSRTPDGGRVDWRIAAPDGLAAPIDPADLGEALGGAYRECRAPCSL